MVRTPSCGSPKTRFESELCPKFSVFTVVLGEQWRHYTDLQHRNCAHKHAGIIWNALWKVFVRKELSLLHTNLTYALERYPMGHIPCISRTPYRCRSPSQGVTDIWRKSANCPDWSVSWTQHSGMSQLATWWRFCQNMCLNKWGSYNLDVSSFFFFF